MVGLLKCSQNLRTNQINIIFATEGQMEIAFEKDYLKDLYYEGQAKDKHHRFQRSIVKRYIRVVNTIESVRRPEDLYRYRSLHYEHLSGDKAGLDSVRVNDKYRLELRLVEGRGIVICNIVELSNHYR